MLIRIGHSPDSDDAFMFWGLASGEVTPRPVRGGSPTSPARGEVALEFEHVLRDIQTLNEWAREGELESSAVSVHAFAYVSDRYALLRHGGSFGEGYGPMVVAAAPMSPDELQGLVIAVPGTLTSAFLELNLFFRDRFGPAHALRYSLDLPKTDTSGELAGGLKYAVVPFDQIIPAVKEGRYKAGLIIHEGQLTYAKEGLHMVLDLGRWWCKKTGLPLPLGVNVVRKDLGPEIVREVSRCMRESIDAGLKDRDRALQYALQFARGMDSSTSDAFVGMYVNERTRDMGEDGVRAIRLLLSEGARCGLTPEVEVEVVD